MRTALLALMGFAVGLFCVPGHCQVLRGKVAPPKRTGGTQALQVEGDGGSRRSDLEGSIWEFKVMENSDQNRSTRTKMTGYFRIKQSALFAIGEVEYADSDDQQKGEEADVDPRAAIRARLQGGEPTPASGGNGQLGGRLGGLLAGGGPPQVGQTPEVSERMGDLAKQKSNELQFRFDEDDSYPLSGRSTIKPDKNDRGGLWIGSYDEFVNGKKKKRWRFEMRKVEE